MYLTGKNEDFNHLKKILLVSYVEECQAFLALNLAVCIVTSKL